MNPKPVPSANNNNNNNNNHGNEQHVPSLDNTDVELQCWFLSLVCLDSPVHALVPTRERSAFSWYQRPVAETKQTNASLVDTTLDEDDNENEDEDRDRDDDKDGGDGDNDGIDEREDVENYFTIDRTFSFDDWDDVDDYNPATPISPMPHVFRFDDWSTASKDSDVTCIDTKLPSPSKSYPRAAMLSIETSGLDSLAATPRNPMYYVKYHNDNSIPNNESSSMMVIVPPSNSYLFQPIQEGNSSRLSVSITAPPTWSIRSIDEHLSLDDDDDEVANIINNHDVTIPECPGIPRVGSDEDDDLDEDNELYHPVIVSIHCRMDDSSPCMSSPTNHYDYNPNSTPPIPPVIYLPPRELTGIRRTIQRSWNRVVSIRRRDYGGRNKRFTSSGRRFVPRKGLRGEF